MASAASISPVETERKDTHPTQNPSRTQSAAAGIYERKPVEESLQGLFADFIESTENRFYQIYRGEERKSTCLFPKSNRSMEFTLSYGHPEQITKRSEQHFICAGGDYDKSEDCQAKEFDQTVNIFNIPLRLQGRAHLPTKEMQNLWGPEAGDDAPIQGGIPGELFNMILVTMRSVEEIAVMQRMGFKPSLIYQARRLWRLPGFRKTVGVAALVGSIGFAVLPWKAIGVISAVSAVGLAWAAWAVKKEL